MYLSYIKNVILGDRVNVCGAKGCAGWAVQGVYWALGGLLFVCLPVSLTHPSQHLLFHSRFQKPRARDMNRFVGTRVADSGHGVSRGPGAGIPGAVTRPGGSSVGRSDPKPRG